MYQYKYLKSFTCYEKLHVSIVTSTAVSRRKSASGRTYSPLLDPGHTMVRSSVYGVNGLCHTALVPFKSTWYNAMPNIKYTYHRYCCTAVVINCCAMFNHAHLNHVTRHHALRVQYGTYRQITEQVFAREQQRRKAEPRQRPPKET